MAENNPIGLAESAISIAVLIVVLAVVLEVLANVPGVDIVDENPLGFILDWMGAAVNDEDSDDSSGDDGGSAPWEGII
jgi:hypothetical protein